MRLSLGGIGLTCDYWECKHRDTCPLVGRVYPHPPCAMCTSFDGCGVCAHYIECCDLVCKFLPNMFRRLVREIRHGENLENVQQYIRMNTHGSKRDG